MKTIELGIATLLVGGVYVSYVYYLLEKDNDVVPTNLWFNIGHILDEVFFNSGVKPKKAIKDAPNPFANFHPGE